MIWLLSSPRTSLGQGPLLTLCSGCFRNTPGLFPPQDSYTCFSSCIESHPQPASRFSSLLEYHLLREASLTSACKSHPTYPSASISVLCVIFVMALSTIRSYNFLFICLMTCISNWNVNFFF